MHKDLSPEHIRPLGKDEEFKFACHPGVECFTECCRDLELALTPYDVLRMRAKLGLTTGEFLEQYCLFEVSEEDGFPRVFLGMVDDGKGSCPFVSKDGCAIYEDRPAACRTYPVGRGAFRKPDGGCEDLYVLLSEPHCKGFGQESKQDVGQWLDHEGLADYNAMNDATLAVYHHLKVNDGITLTDLQVETFILAFYNLDAFREGVLAGEVTLQNELDDQLRREIADDDKALLLFAVEWLRWQLFEG
ncbi:MAG: YkgJ family cysteine cluster protein [Desulfobulbaceae bacterium]|nr:YkgJ family cysteine cluster protein [Desulfobulbaceae bacterium]